MSHRAGTVWFAGGAMLIGVALVAFAAFGLVSWQRVPHLLIGLAIGLVGGVLTGAVARRLLRAPKTTFQIILGIALTGLVGTLVIGYLYLVHIEGGMAAIGTAERAIEQTTAFVEFWCGLGIGALWTRAA